MQPPGTPGPLQKPGQRDDNVRYFCKNCKEDVPNIIEDYSAGEMVCGTCGLVLGPRIIDSGSEWRTFANSDEGTDDPSRIGGVSDPLLGANRLESTYIGARDGGNGRSAFLNRAQSKVVPTERALMEAWRKITMMGERINANKVTLDTAKQIYRMVTENSELAPLLRSEKKQEGVMAATLYIACRQHGVARTFKEVCAITKVKSREIGKLYKAVQSGLKEGVALNERVNIDVYVQRYAPQLKLTPKETRDAGKMARIMQEEYLGGRNYGTVVSCAIWIALYINNAELIDESDASNFLTGKLSKPENAANIKRLRTLNAERVAKVHSLLLVVNSF